MSELESMALEAVETMNERVDWELCAVLSTYGLSCAIFVGDTILWSEDEGCTPDDGWTAELIRSDCEKALREHVKLLNGLGGIK